MHSMCMLYLPQYSRWLKILTKLVMVYSVESVSIYIHGATCKPVLEEDVGSNLNKSSFRDKAHLPPTSFRIEVPKLAPFLMLCIDIILSTVDQALQATLVGRNSILLPITA